MKIEIDTEIFRKQLKKVFRYYVRDIECEYEYLNENKVKNIFLSNEEKIISDVLNSDFFKKALISGLIEYIRGERSFEYSFETFFFDLDNDILESVKKKLSQENKIAKRDRLKREKEKEILDLRKKINKLGLSIVDNKILSKIVEEKRKGGLPKK